MLYGSVQPKKMGGFALLTYMSFLYLHISKQTLTEINSVSKI